MDRGGQSVPNSGPDSDWRWITGEPWSFTNWSFDEPNDAGEDEFYLVSWDPRGTWNDADPDSTYDGYLVEFPFPISPDSIVIPAKDLFRRAMDAMNNLKSFRMEGQIVEEHRRGESEMAFEGERSWGSARLVQHSNDRDQESTFERILVPPHVYYSDDPGSGIWYREPMYGTEPFADSMLDAGVYIFPHPDVPLRFYKLNPLGFETIGDVETSHMRVSADWRRIERWLKDKGMLRQAAARTSGYTTEEFLESFSEEPPRLLEVWIDKDGFLRKMTIEFREDGDTGHGDFYYYDFNEPIVIQPPGRFEDVPTSDSIPIPVFLPTTSPTLEPEPSPTHSPTIGPRVRPGQTFGPLIEIRYNNSLRLCGCDREFAHQWEPGKWLYESEWDYYTDYPVALTATFDRPLDIHDENRRPSIVEESGLYTYTWRPDDGTHINFEPRVVADSGLLLSRSVTPNILQPGTTKVIVRASVKLIRPPSVHDNPVEPIGVNLSIDLHNDQWYDGIEDIRVVSESDDTWRDFGPFFDESREYVMEVEAVLENPNPFPVSYLPAVSASLEIDTESTTTPFEVFLPRGFEASSADVSFEAVGLGGEWVRFTFTNPDNGNSSWIYEGELRGISHWWQSAIRPAR